MAALVNLDILIASGDRLHCLDILHALTRRVLGDVEDTEHFRKVSLTADDSLASFLHAVPRSAAWFLSIRIFQLSIITSPFEWVDSKFFCIEQWQMSLLHGGRFLCSIIDSTALCHYWASYISFLFFPSFFIFYFSFSLSLSLSLFPFLSLFFIFLWTIETSVQHTHTDTHLHTPAHLMHEIFLPLLKWN